ncbi:MAG: nucleotidyltransferase [Ruminococcus sp.]|nr:nucleotidyltransferase [Ruminococcus sp.]
MAEKPVLVIMAAGMGSRYGGLKQMDPVDEDGHIIMDFSVYDAKRAGFEKVVFIIKKAIEADFKEGVGNRIGRHMDVEYVYQEPDVLPEGFEVPAGREKPFGTGHAVLCCKDVVKGPFAVINADDYYGVHAFEEIYHYLTANEDDGRYHFAMVSYILANTLTDNGYVSRGVCEMDGEGYLTGIRELTHIEKRGDGVAYTEDGGATWEDIRSDTLVSMNMFGFSAGMLKELEGRFPAFLEKGLVENPLKCEYFLPSVVSGLIAEKKAAVKVLRSEDKWHGITYKEDKEEVVRAISKLKEDGVYPRHLWE